MRDLIAEAGRSPLEDRAFEALEAAIWAAALTRRAGVIARSTPHANSSSTTLHPPTEVIAALGQRTYNTLRGTEITGGGRSGLVPMVTRTNGLNFLADLGYLSINQQSFYGVTSMKRLLMLRDVCRCSSARYRAAAKPWSGAAGRC